MLWGPVVAYVALIFGMSAVPNAPAPPLGLSDKWAHALEYAGLSVLTIRALAKATWAGVGVTAVLGTMLIAVAQGLADETFQRFIPGRHSDWRDLVADSVGAGVAVAAIGAWGIIRRLSRARGDRT